MTRATARGQIVGQRALVRSCCYRLAAREEEAVEETVDEALSA